MFPLSDKELKWVNVKLKPFRQIQGSSGIIRLIQKLFRHVQAYSEPCVTVIYVKPILNSSCFTNNVRELTNTNSSDYKIIIQLP